MKFELGDEPGTPADVTVPITGLLSFRVRRLANLLSSSAGMRYRREFDVSLPEWRTIALLGRARMTTVNKLARLAALDKGQMSRVISGLVERGFIAKETGPRASSQLTLTETGTALYEQLITAANERDQFVLGALSEQEQAAFEQALEKLTDAAIILDHREKEEP